jgi:hypothetical protein
LSQAGRLAQVRNKGTSALLVALVGIRSRR